jgi:hypothetical protein
MVVILSQRTNAQKLHKVSHFQFRKNLYQKQSCTKSANFFVEHSIGYAIGKGEVVMRSNNRCTDLAYIHFFLKAEILSQRINI